MDKDLQIIEMIIEELNIAESMLRGISVEEFLSNEKLKKAIYISIINIGELANNISNKIQVQNRHINWSKISGFRDIATKKYKTIKMEDIYTTVTQDFPLLINNMSLLKNKIK
jgi:uncharacterized protein with HEPN domain